jgi:hypothetical protein
MRPSGINLAKKSDIRSARQFQRCPEPSQARTDNNYVMFAYHLFPNRPPLLASDVYVPALIARVNGSDRFFSSRVVSLSLRHVPLSRLMPLFTGDVLHNGSGFSLFHPANMMPAIRPQLLRFDLPESPPLSSIIIHPLAEVKAIDFLARGRVPDGGNPPMERANLLVSRSSCTQEKKCPAGMTVNQRR